MFPAMATMNISLPDDMKALVEARVRNGLYANVSDYVRDLIRADLTEDEWEMDAATAAALDEGEASGIGDRSLDEIFAEARAQFASR
jgi:antitoxin ParD1/3/4